ncbi:hypothetical protein [Intrasporangium sp. YIM S08009]|uniref:hypothetical protein n=1 Tax=Intrasporangium zincisolvens TaxID=3080018 RepID=UPI002B05966E|nr:hypothetical protein [Intrasporangium sp. YIM S08009]
MTRRLSSGCAVAALAVVLGAGGCQSGDEPADLPGPSSTSYTFTVDPPSTVVTTDSETDTPPPPPHTDCLPATPVELDLGPFLRACAVTPTHWTITNTSRTVIALSAAAGSVFPRVTTQSDASAGSRADVSELLSGIYDLYRSSDPQHRWLQPDATVDVWWPGDTPGTLAYQPTPADSAAMSAASALVESAIDDWDTTPGRVTPEDVLGCYEGVRDLADSAAKGQLAPTLDTWNTAVDGGLTAHTCLDLIPEQTRDELKGSIVKAGQETWSEVVSRWHQLFSIAVKR